MSNSGGNGPVGQRVGSKIAAASALNRRNLVAGLVGATAGTVGWSSPASAQEESASKTRGSVVNIKDLGAIGDGATDDTAAISASLETIGGGGAIFIPGGTYLIDPVTAPLVVKSNMTILGEGPRSVLKVKDNAGNYDSIFRASTPSTLVEHVRFCDFTIDQNPAGNATGDIQPLDGQQQYVIALYTFRDVSIERVRFDPYIGVNAVSLNGAGTRTARIAQSYFRFQRGVSANSAYDNSAIYLECENHLVEGCFFEAALSERAFGAIETHNGPSTISNNLTDGFQTGVNIVAEFHAIDTRETNDINVTGNTFSRASIGISLWSGTDRLLRNITVANNTISVAQVSQDTRHSSGIQLVYLVGPDQQGSFEDISIVGNTIVFETEPVGGRETDKGGEVQDPGTTYGIGLAPFGDVTNVLVAANIVTRAPVSGLALGNEESGNTSRNVRIVDNIFTDAGQNSGVADSFRTAIAMESTLHDVVVEHNSIVDTGDTLFGNQAFYVQPTSATRVYVRQNHIGANAGTLTSTLDRSQVQVFEQTIASGVTSPESGSWLRGDIVYHLEPMPGGHIGWVCVTAGEPGVWRIFGAIG